MNKKISTLFTAGLLVAGSLFSSAWAEELKIAADPTKWANVDTEKQYILASPAWFNGTEFSTDSHDFYVIAYKNTENETKIGIGPKEKGELIVWDVTAQLNSSGVMDYSFSSSFGDLSVTYKVMENEKEVEKTQTAFQKGNDAPNSSAALKWMVSASLQYEIGATQSDVNGVYNLAAQTTGLSNSTQSFALYEVFNTNPGEELNELYNNKGFSFVLRMARLRTSSINASSPWMSMRKYWRLRISK